MTEPMVFSVEEVAQLLGVSTSLIYEHAKKGTLPFPAYRIGRTWRFKRTEVEAAFSTPLYGQAVGE